MDDLIKKLKNVSPKDETSSAVLIPLIEENDHLSLLYEVRSASIAQPLEVCFPGGHLEKGENALMAVKRECEEELLIKPEQLKIIRSLPGALTVTRKYVAVYAGILEDYDYTYASAEVDHIFTVPLDYLLKHEPARYQVEYLPKPAPDFPIQLAGGRDKLFPFKKDLLFYQYQAEVIWGLTAAITYDFTRLIQS